MVSAIDKPSQVPLVLLSGGGGGARLAAALSISGPAFRLDSERLLREAVPELRSCAEYLSRELGYAG